MWLQMFPSGNELKLCDNSAPFILMSSPPIMLEVKCHQSIFIHGGSESDLREWSTDTLTGLMGSLRDAVIKRTDGIISLKGKTFHLPSFLSWELKKNEINLTDLKEGAERFDWRLKAERHSLREADSTMTNVNVIGEIRQ